MKAVDLTQIINMVEVADFYDGASHHCYDLEDGTAVEFKTFIDTIGKTVYPFDHDAEPYFNGVATVQVYELVAYDKDGNVIPHSDVSEFAVKLENRINDAL